MADCVALEMTDGSWRAYAYPDAATATAVYDEARADWNAGGNLVFYVRSHYGPTNAIHAADDVAHVELATRDAVRERRIDYAEAFTFG